MLWLEGGLSFLLWIAYGVIQSRRSDAIRRQVGRMSRGSRAVLGASLFLVGAMVLIGGLGIVLQAGGFASAGMTPIAWTVVTVLGLGFVHAQTLGTAMLVSLVQENVTNAPKAASMNTAPGDRIES
ncbi:MAG TPA: hypothetical protein VMI31_11230 [Fimbriimonadaceae bacterium]|nr:hypothetical protein [Fimbriimonadaceae bacterium]